MTANDIDQRAIIEFISDTCAGVDVLSPDDGVGAGDTFFIYDPDRNLDVKQRMPFATIVTKDYGDFDCTSNLNRPGIFRLNIGVTRETFRALFGQPESSTELDFAALDRLMPHPVYARQSFVCVLNPSAETFRAVQPLLAEAYNQAARGRAPVR
jgi:hypothetical protein